MGCVAFSRGMIGLRQSGVPRFRPLRPDTLPMTPGQRASLFKVRAAEDERFWIGEANDRHLSAAIAVVVEEGGQGQKRFHVLTIVHYHNCTGPLYFNAIRPFHHLVVGSMVHAGVQGECSKPKASATSFAHLRANELLGWLAPIAGHRASFPL